MENWCDGIAGGTAAVAATNIHTCTEQAQHVAGSDTSGQLDHWSGN